MKTTKNKEGTTGNSASFVKKETDIDTIRPELAEMIQAAFFQVRRETP